MNQNTLTLLIPADGNTTDVSFGGVNYPVENGKVTVPVEAAEHLYQFGFTNAPPELPKTSKPSGKKQGNKPTEPPAADKQSEDEAQQDSKQDSTPTDDNNGQNDGSNQSA